ncbi:MAG: Bax inhibitor-1/YccA family protein [Sphingobacteriales bacterium]|nr:MAG: Bax inhibitor-1/YccA family protein [Sphingobacteriales bacterium]
MENQDQNQWGRYTVLESNPAKPVAKTFMANVFLWMFAALGISTFFAYLFASTPSLLQYLINATGTGLSIFGWVVMLSPLAFVLLLSRGIERFSFPVLISLYIVFASLMGMSLSFVLLVYTAGSVVGCFAAASVMFGIMAVMGYTTDKDLTGFGRIMTMGLIGIIVASLINFFMKSSQLEYIVSFVGVLVFTGLTAYDVQKLKRIGEGMEYDGAGMDSVRKRSILGAMSLYLDFINLFLMLLRLFGGRRN